MKLMSDIEPIVADYDDDENIDDWITEIDFKRNDVCLGNDEAQCKTRKPHHGDGRSSKYEKQKKKRCAFT